MKVTLVSTEKVVTLDGVPCRLWQGTTADGIPMHAFIALVGVDREADVSEFARDLSEHATPRPEYQGIPLRLIL